MNNNIETKVANCMVKFVMDGSFVMDPRRKFFYAASCYCIPYIPGIVNKALDYTKDIVINSESIHIKFKDFEITLKNQTLSS